MKWSATTPPFELALSALIREIFSDHPEDRALLPLHVPPAGDRMRRMPPPGVPQGLVRCRPSGGRLP